MSKGNKTIFRMERLTNNHHWMGNQYQFSSTPYYDLYIGVLITMKVATLSIFAVLLTQYLGKTFSTAPNSYKF